MSLRERVEPCRPHYFNTANGHSQSDSKLELDVAPLKRMASAIIMDQTPAVLSVGARQKQGFSFIWMTGFQPCWIRPDRTIVVLDAMSDIPYLMTGGAFSKNYSDVELTSTVGLPAADGKLVRFDQLPVGVAEIDSKITALGSFKKDVDGTAAGANRIVVSQTGLVGDTTVPPAYRWLCHEAPGPAETNMNSQRGLRSARFRQ